MALGWPRPVVSEPRGLQRHRRCWRVAGSSRQAFASLDLERGFVPDREVTASGMSLSTGMGATRVRPGLGCALDPDAAGTIRLSSQGHCITAGSGNTGYGGSVPVTFSF